MLNRLSLMVQTRMRVSDTGEVSDCVVQYSNFTKKEQRAICGMLEDRAQFEPARDAPGNPVPALTRASFLMFVFD